MRYKQLFISDDVLLNKIKKNVTVQQKFFLTSHPFNSYLKIFMKIYTQLLLTGVLGLTVIAGFAQPSKVATAAVDNQPAPMVLLVPVEVSNRALEAGCWAQFYDERNFKGEILTVVGPASIDSMDKGSGKQLKRSIDSLVTGPKTLLKIYEHQMFKDKSVDFPANSKEAGLIRKLGFGGNIQSLQLSCAK